MYKKYLLLVFFIFANLLTLASKVIEIPFYYDTERQAIFIYAELGSKKGYFTFDTGSDMSMIFDDEVNYSGFTVSQKNRNIWIGNMDLTMNMYSSSNITLAGNLLSGRYNFTVTNNPLIIDNFSAGIAGILGMDIFHGKIFEISMTDSVIRIYDKIPNYYENKLPILSETYEDLRLYIPVKINGNTYKALIDTGASFSFGLSENILLDNGENSVKVYISKAYSAPYNRDFKLVRKNSVEIMGIALNNKIFKTHTHDEVKNEAIIGTQFLARFDMLIDLRNEHKFMLYYKQNLPSEYFSLFINGDMEVNGIINANINGVNLEILEILENSPAWIAGLRAGALITHLNSKPVLSYTIDSIRTLLLGKNLLKVTFIDSNGKEKTVKVKPKKML